MCYLTDGAQDAIPQADRNPVEVETHQCVACKEQFYQGEGVLIEEEKFCLTCIADFKHFDFYEKVCGLEANDIYEITKKMTGI